VFLNAKGEKMFKEIAENRRSIRKFSKRKVEQEKIDVLLEVALRSPSARGSRSWEFIVITEPELLEKISLARPGGAAFIKNASVAIVVCGDTSKSALWVENCAIAAVSMQYAATSLGLGSRWAHMRGKDYNEEQSSRDYLAELLGCPDNVDIECVIAFGYADEEAAPYPKEDLPFDKVSYNRFGQKTA